MLQVCQAAVLKRLMATCQQDQVDYFLHLGFWTALQPPPNFYNPTLDMEGQLQHVRFFVEGTLGVPASNVLGGTAE